MAGMCWSCCLVSCYFLKAYGSELELKETVTGRIMVSGSMGSTGGECGAKGRGRE
jgi:hypothetical protein